MIYDFIFLLEEKSMANVLNVLLPKIIPLNKTFICIAHEGKQDLARSIPIKIRAFRNSSSRFIIIHDQDSHDCQTLKQELLKLCGEIGKTRVLIHIVCRELESWFLGDLAAVEKAFSLKSGSLVQFQQKAKFRQPDQLNSAAQELKKLLKSYKQEYYKIGGS